MRTTIFKKFAHSVSGNIAMMFGLLLFVILASAGIALDYQRAVTIRTNMQEAADAALIAAVKHKQLHPNMTIAEIEARAKAIFESNMRNMSEYTYSKFDVVFDPVAGDYTLNFDAKIETRLLQAVHFAEITPKVVSKAKLGKPPYLEVVMVLDNTGSMNSKGKLGDLKKAAKSLVATLYANPDADVKIGLVPFAQYVSVGADKSGQFWLDVPKSKKKKKKKKKKSTSFKGCVGSRNYPANTTDFDYNVNPVPAVLGAPCPNDLLALTDNRTTIENAIDAMKGSGWTYIPAGLAWGWRVISAEAPFTEGVTAAELKDKNGFKAIILMTDGENTKSPDYPTHNKSDIINANKITDELCDAIKKENIIVYTIAFAVTDNTIKALLEDCGSTPSHYFEPNTTGELSAAFESIAGSLRTIALTQ